MKGHLLTIRRNGAIQAALPVYEVTSWLTRNMPDTALTVVGKYCYRHLR